jgi:hypothetical protein
MPERTDAITNEVAEPITFVLAYPTVSLTRKVDEHKAQHILCTTMLTPPLIIRALTVNDPIQVLISAAITLLSHFADMCIYYCKIRL